MSDLPVDQIREAVLHLHPCEGADFVERVRVVEKWEGETVWEGDVTVFDLRGHPSAKRCYAWSHYISDKSERRAFVAVLHQPPIDSASMAVRLSLIRDHKHGT